VPRSKTGCCARIRRSLRKARTPLAELPCPRPRLHPSTIAHCSSARTGRSAAAEIVNRRPAVLSRLSWLKFY